MKKSKILWICLRCGHKWAVDNRKVDPRYCPLCGSCTIYVPKEITIPKFHVSNQSSAQKESVLHIDQKNFYEKKEIEAIAR